jgi:hypothetical protein
MVTLELVDFKMGTGFRRQGCMERTIGRRFGDEQKIGREPGAAGTPSSGKLTDSKQKDKLLSSKAKNGDITDIFQLLRFEG